MSLTNAQKLAIKKHLGWNPFTIQMDQMFVAIDADSDKLTELLATLTDCDNALATIDSAESASDEIKSGGGAEFDYNRNIATKTAAYERKRSNLSRVMGFPILDDSDMYATTHGWFGG